MTTVMRRALLGVTIGAVALVGGCKKDSHEDAVPFAFNPTFPSETDYPFVVKLVDHPSGLVVCGGVAIRDRWVLTAAHCVDQQGVLPKRIVPAGEGLMDGRSFTRFCHPHYANGGSADSQHDVALLELTSDADDLPAKWRDPVAVRALAANEAVVSFGWGKPTVGTIQRTLPMPAASAAECQSRYMHQVVQPDQEICAGSALSAPCRGDSGGPLFTVRRSGATWSQEEDLLGVVSQADSDCMAVGPAIFAGLDADDRTQWLDKVIGGDPAIRDASAQACQ